MSQPNGAVAVRRARLPVNQTAAVLGYLRGRPNEQVRFTEVVQGTGLDAGRVANILSRQLKKPHPANTDWLCVRRVEFGFYEFRPDRPRDGAQGPYLGEHRRSVKWDPIVRNAETGEWLLRSPDQQLYVAKPAPSIFEEGG